jgi:tetratricopeptide (TPR) repeat protein
MGIVVAGSGMGCNQAADSDSQSILGRQSTPASETSTIPARVHLDRAVKSKNWDEAEKWVRQALIETPDNPKVFKNAAVIYGRSGRKAEAAEMMAASVAAAGGNANVADVQLAFQAMMDAGQFYDAAEMLEQALKRMPDQLVLRRNLVGFYGEVELPEQAKPHVEYLIRQRAFDLPFLKTCLDTSYRRFSQTSINLLRERNPNDQRIRLGEARKLFDDSDFLASIGVLREIIAKHPEFAPAHALMGRCLIAEGQYDQLPQWLAQCPDSVQSIQNYWLTLGDWSTEVGDAAGAARAYGEATQLDANDAAAWAGYAAALRSLDDGQTTLTFDQQQLTRTAEAAQKRYADLLELRKAFYQNEKLKEKSQQSLTAISRKLLALGRLWEAEAWSAIASTLEGQPDEGLPGLRKQIIEQLQSDRDWQVTRGNDAFAIDINVFPMPSILKNPGNEGHQQKQTKLAQFDTDPLPIRLEDQAEQRGIQFFGRTGDTVDGPLVILRDSLGCGGACIDFDLDGNQDLILLAAGGSFMGRDSEPNRCFRNLDGQFNDVTTQSHCGDTGFGQGVAVGDVNDDGFADMLLLNLGANRMLQNNGDGTFTDISDRMGKELMKWSVSGAIFDVDGDGLNDYYVVNYCEDKNGKFTAIHPLSVPASHDNVYLGLPTGGFQLPPGNVIECESPGRGLGIIAGNLDSQGMSAYVANDMSANHYYRLGSAHSMPYRDVGSLNGLAVFANTQTQASMGMASGDFDHDGDLDFYITGFAREYNIYYEQQSPGMWVDRSVALGLSSPTLPFVGFGTQAIDLDNDGLEELLITNGHISDFGEGFPPYAQQFQLFRRQSDGGFLLEDISGWGDYFSNPHVGRAMWRGDLDQDGRSDAVVTHATEPVAVLMNRSRSGNYRIGFRLVATNGPRDAIGATIRFEVQTRASVAPTKRTLFRLAGDGFMTTNEDVLRAGTGKASEVNRLVVTWSNGQEQNFGSVACGSDYVLVQGHSDAFEVRRFKEVEN